MQSCTHLTFNSTGEAAARTATAALVRYGLHVVRSFDLRSARTPHINCECPHHGTAQCACQYVALPVYGDPSTSFGFAQNRRSGRVATAPLGLTLHSHDDRTSAQIVRDAANAPDPGLAEQVMAALTEAALGDEVEILGRKFEIMGLSEGTASLVNSVAFVSLADFAALRGTPGSVSFLLVKVKPGDSAEAVAARIESEVDDATAQSTTEFAVQERKVIKDMSTDVIALMNAIGFLLGLAVMALTVYTATFARRAEYGVLKALGARNGHLYRAVLMQALISVALGFALGLIFTLAVSAVAPRLSLTLALEVSGASLIKVGAVSLIIGGLAAILPIRQIAGLDPAMVFRGK